MSTDKHVCIWWSINLPGKAMDVLFCGHCDAGKDATPTLAKYPFGHRDNRASPDNPPSSDENSGDNCAGLSSAPAKRMSLMRKLSRPTKKTTAGVQHRSPGKVSDLEPDSKMVSDNATNLASDAIPALPFSLRPSPHKQPSPANLHIHIFRHFH